MLSKQWPAYSALLRDELVLTVFSDPPWNVQIEGNVSELGKKRHRDFAMACGELTESEFTHFLVLPMALFARHSAEGSVHLVCLPPVQQFRGRVRH